MRAEGFFDNAKGQRVMIFSFFKVVFPYFRTRKNPTGSFFEQSAGNVTRR